MFSSTHTILLEYLCLIRITTFTYVDIVIQVWQEEEQNYVHFIHVYIIGCSCDAISPTVVNMTLLIFGISG